MRITKVGQVNFTFRGGQQSIDRDSDPREVRDLRDACQRWLDEKADEDAASAAMVSGLMRVIDVGATACEDPS